MISGARRTDYHGRQKKRFKSLLLALIADLQFNLLVNL